MLKIKTQPFDDQPEEFMYSENTKDEEFLSAKTRKTMAQMNPFEILKKEPKICRAGR